MCGAIGRRPHVGRGASRLRVTAEVGVAMGVCDRLSRPHPNPLPVGEGSVCDTGTAKLVLAAGRQDPVARLKSGGWGGTLWRLQFLATNTVISSGALS